MSLSGMLSGLALRAGYPVIIIATLATAHVALAYGVPAVVVVSLSFVSALGVTAILEWARPFDARSKPSVAEVRQDAVYLGIAAALQPVGKLAGSLVATILTLAVSAAVGTGTGWPIGPLWLRVLLAFSLADFGKYWLHRVSHERPWWWRFHAEHHAPSRVYSLNGVRLHPVNLLWNFTLDVAGPIAFGLDARSIVLLAVFGGTVSVLQHANVDLRLRGLHWVFSTPDLHRWHHSTDLREANANYGSTFIVWDVLFGTRRLPRERAAPAALGWADGASHPRGLWRELIWPWCGARMPCGPRAALSRTDPSQ